MRSGQRKLVSLALFLLAAAGLQSPVSAQSWPIPPMYSLGNSAAYGHDGSADSSRLHPFSLTHSVSPNLGASLSWRAATLFGGDLRYGGEIRYSALLSQGAASTAFKPSLSQRFDYQSVPVTFNAYASLAPRTELIGRAGLVLSNPSAAGRQCLNASGAVYDCQSTPLTYGLGLRYQLYDSVRLRMDYDFLESRELSFGARSRSSFLSFGATYQY